MSGSSKNQTLSEFAYKNNCYSIWEHFDELDEKYKLNEDIDFLYYNFIYNAIDAYFHNVHKLKIPYSKLEKIIFNTKFREKYLIKKIVFNKDFEKIAKLCLTVKDRDENYSSAREFYNFLMLTFKDFDINNYSLKSKC